MSKTMAWLLAMGFILATALSAGAQVWWTGADPNDNLWTTATNWNTGMVPTASDPAGSNVADPCMTKEILIDNTVSGVCTTFQVGVNTGPAYARVAGGSLNGSGAFDIGVQATGVGYVTVDGGSFTTTNAIRIGTSGAGTVTVLDGTVTSGIELAIGNNATGNGTLEIQGGQVNCGRHFRVGYNGVGVINMSGGVLDVTNNAAAQTDIGGQAGASGTINISGGTIEYAGANFWCGKDGTGTVNMTGGTINALNAYLDIPRLGGTGHLQLDGGVFNTFEFRMRFAGGTGTMDVAGGTLIISADRTADINTYIQNGWITAYGGHPRATFNLDYDETNAGKTTLSATIPDVNLAWNPAPGSGETIAAYESVTSDVILTWSPGDNAAKHDVYFGTDEALVAAGDASVYQGRFDPCSFNAGVLAMGETYYWRVDEVDAGETMTWEGTVWSFGIADYLVIDDFEQFDANLPLANVWTSNGLAQMVVEETVIDTALTPDDLRAVKATFSNASSLSRTPPFADMTTGNVEAMLLRFHGVESNAANEANLYVTLSDGTNSASVFYAGDDSIMEGDFVPYNDWNIDLGEFAGVNLANVTGIVVGIAGTSADAIYLDNLRLYVPRCVPAEIPGEIANDPDDDDDDCSVNLYDLDRLLADWLVQDYTVTAVDPGAGGLRLYYPFDETGTTQTASDASGNGFDGQVNTASPGWDTDGVVNGCIAIDGTYGVKVIYSGVNATLFDTITDEITVSCWFKGDPAIQPATDVIFHANAPGVNRVILSSCPFFDGRIVWHAGSNPFDEAVYFAQLSSEFEGVWNHVGMTKNVATGVQRLYLNGELVGENTAAFAPFVTPTAFAIGSYAAGAAAGSYSGKLDEFRLYDRELSQAEIAFLAGQASVNQEILTPADTNDDGIVNIADFAAVSALWMQGSIDWPY